MDKFYCEECGAEVENDGDLCDDCCDEYEWDNEEDEKEDD